MNDLFDSSNYRDFLRNSFPGSGDRRGRRRALAEALGCQTSFISLVLTDRAHFNEDMTFATAKFLTLNSPETEFLLLLYHFERAATPELRQYYKIKINKSLESRKQIKSRVRESPTIPLEIQAQYYSNWVFSAIHTVVMCAQTRTIDKIAKKINISEKLVEESLIFLTQWQFVKETTQGFEPGVNRLHLDSTSPFIIQHHRNWHLEAMRSVGERRDGDFNYSGALSVGRADVAAIKEILLKSVSAIESQIAQSPDEEAIGLTMSCFKY
ncbi:MAG: TIGR02147 family protein [Pseudomonadota bacterium]|nr:TIGR02147 family protein [Pseudomonadota bacterium]